MNYLNSISQSTSHTTLQRNPPFYSTEKTDSYSKVPITVDIAPLRKKLINHPEYFGKYNYRKEWDNSPHSEMTDIWVRFGDIVGVSNGTKDYRDEVINEHDSIWLPAYKDLHNEIDDPVFDLMKAVKGVRLGGILITKLPPGGKIKPHTDHGWHASYYDKYFIPVLNKPGAVFGFNEGSIHPHYGDVWWFNNAYSHWVNNNTNSDRIALIVCIRS